MSETCITSSKAATRGMMFLPVVVAAAISVWYGPASATISAAVGSASMCAYAGASASSTLATPSSLAAASATGLQFCPATRMWTSPPSCLAAVSALLVASLSEALLCSATRSVGMSDRSRLFELLHEFAHALDLDAGLAHRRFGGLDHFEPRLDVDAVIGGGLFVDRLLFCLHDIGQGGVARLVEPQISGDDRRRFQLHRLQAAVDLACDRDRI